MFFKHAYGKVQFYPYLHIVTWGLPRRYFSFLRLFNLKLEENPYQFLTQCSDSLINYEVQESRSSAPSTSGVKPPPLPVEENLNHQDKHKDIHESYLQLSQSISEICAPPSGSSRRFKKKSVISIKINLDDNLETIKSKKKLNRLFLKGGDKSYHLVIGKSSRNKKNEYCLSIVNDRNHSSLPYHKLLKKNRKRKSSENCLQEVSCPSYEVEKFPSSIFTAENVYPPLIKTAFLMHNQKNLIEKQKDPIDNVNEENGSEIIPEQLVGLKSDTLAQHEILEETCENKRTLKLLNQGILKGECSEYIPTNSSPDLAQCKELRAEEKPLRYWPMISQIINQSNIDIYKHYLQGQNVENKIKSLDRTDKLAFNIEAAKRFHESMKTSTLTTESKILKCIEENEKYTEDRKLFSIGSSLPSFKDFQPIDIPPTRSFDRIPLQLGSRRPDLSDIYTTTAYIEVGGGSFIAANNSRIWKIQQTNYPTEYSSDNSRLLSTAAKTYEAIQIPYSQAQQEIYGQVRDKGEGVQLKDVTDEALEEHDAKNKIKYYVIGILIATLVTILLGMVLFIVVSDSNMARIKEYFHRMNI